MRKQKKLKINNKWKASHENCNNNRSNWTRWKLLSIVIVKKRV